MDFSTIQKVLGESKISEEWYETKERKIFEMRYSFDKYEFWFYSFDGISGNNFAFWLINNINTVNPGGTPQNDDTNTLLYKKITPEEAKNLILKFRNYRIDELSLDRIDIATGEYYITRESGYSKGNAGITYRINPITGDVYNDLNNNFEFNLFKADEIFQISGIIQENELVD